ncbi:hypothetical protein [Pedobacter sp. UBA4863]|uniref:hypothetical protein n=1 Tax=Pedobacter sp. UBA4863 TaxID=1947060 RepID=UPI0025E60452|nr:hypothetical protein [Pedobacter sp. UBA4863]
MKKLLLTFSIALAFGTVKAQTTVTAKEVVNYVGKEVTLCDSVYSTRAMENISLLNIGGKYPKEVITLVVFKSDRAKFEKEPTELYANKRICVTGKVTLYKDKLQIVVNEPKQVKVN